MTTPYSNAHQFFVDAWNVYRKLVARNYMFHREIYADVGQVLRQSFGRPFTLLDLGCGDASALIPVLKTLDVADYRGVDLSATALNLAIGNIREISCPASFAQADILDYLRANPERRDVIFSSFALHHLATEQKREFFRLCADRLADQGVLLLIDVVREEDQDLPAYLEAYCGAMARQWRGLDAAELEFAVAHVKEYDRPERLSDLRDMAERNGLPEFRHVSQHTWHHVLVFRTGNSRH